MITAAQLLALLRQRSGQSVILDVLDGSWLVEVSDFYSRETLINQDELLTLIGTATQPSKPNQAGMPFLATFKGKDIKIPET